jgi:hypothetical protein
MSDLLGRLFSEGFIYLFTYILLFVIAVVEACKEFSRYKVVWATGTFIFLALFTGLRWETGTDWDSYKDLFDDIEFNWTFLLNVYAFDLGYVLFNALARLFTDNYTIFLLIDSFFALTLVYLFLIKYSFNPNLSFFLFYNAFFIAQFMGSNRRMIAMGAVLFAFYFVYAKSKKKFAVWQGLAFLFHRTSLMVLATWFIPKTRFTTGKIFLVLMVSFILGVFQLPYKFVGLLGDFLTLFFSASNPLIEKLLFYSDSQHNAEVISENINPAILMTLSVVKRSIFLTFYLIVINNCKGVLDHLSDYFFNLYICGFALYMLFNGSPIFQIVSTYFTFIEIALIGRLWFYAGKKLKMGFLVVLFIYGFFQLLSSLAAYPELYMPYKTFLN